MALPNDKITTTLVANTLGSNSRDVGTLCTHTAINKWSKWKPVRYSSVVPITEAQLASIYYGITTNAYDSLQELINVYTTLPAPGNTHIMPKHTYNKPEGGEQSPYRLGDFRNYDKFASQPIGLFTATPIVSISDINPMIEGSIGVSMESPTALDYTDIMRGYHLGIVLVKGVQIVGTSNYEPTNNIVRSNINSSFNTTSVVMNPTLPTKLKSGVYFAYLFMSYNSLGNSYIKGFENHPVKGMRVDVVTSRVTVSIIASYNRLEPNKVDYSVHCNNETGSPVTLTNCVLAFRLSHKECGSALEGFEWQDGYGTLTAPSGKNMLINEQHTVELNNNDGFPLFYKICWSNGGMYPNQFATDIRRPMT